MATTPTNQPADSADTSRPLTPEEIEECEKMRLQILAQCDQILALNE